MKTKTFYRMSVRKYDVLSYLRMPLIDSLDSNILGNIDYVLLPSVKNLAIKLMKDIILLTLLEVH